ncbi:MAG: hypothetical protein AB1Z57_01375 [Acidimicrobiia bacterium]
MDAIVDRRSLAVLVAGFLAVASLAAADVATLVVDAVGSAQVRVSAPSVDADLALVTGDTATVAIPAPGDVLVEQLGTTAVPACDGAVVETSGLVIDESGTTALGGAATVPVGVGDEVRCTVGG